MHFFRKVCLTGSLLLLIFFQTLARQDEPTTWYQNYFTKGSQQPVEKVLEKKANLLLEAIEIQDDSAQARILLETGLVHLTRTFNYEVAMDFFIRSLAISDSLDNPSGRIFSY